MLSAPPQWLTATRLSAQASVTCLKYLNMELGLARLRTCQPALQRKMLLGLDTSLETGRLNPPVPRRVKGVKKQQRNPVIPS